MSPQTWLFRGGLLLSLTLTLSSFAQSRAPRETVKRPSPGYRTVSEGSSVREILRDEKRGKVSSKRLHLGGHFSMVGGGIDYENTESTIVGTGLVADANYLFFESLKANVEMGIRLVSGRGQYSYGFDEFDNGISLYNATLDWEPIRYFKLGVGAVKQSRAVPSDLLIQGSVAFPGAIEQIQFGSKYVSLELLAEQTIPTSRSFDSERQEKEEQPYFLTEQVALNMTPNEHFQVRPYVGRYEFSRLPSKVAFEGSTRGNTVTESFASTAGFVYDFAGIMWGGQILVRFNDKFNITSFYDEVKNNEAPTSFNLGREAGIRSELKTGPLIWKPEYKTYFNESDTSPAYYNSADRGHNNREGDMIGLEVTFPKQYFSIGFRHYDNKLINPNTFQSDGRVYAVYVETAHVEF